MSNELGAKGVGEAGTIASTPAIVNGILDALRPFGCDRHRDAVYANAGLEGDSGCEPHDRGIGHTREAQPHFIARGDNPA